MNCFFLFPFLSRTLPVKYTQGQVHSTFAWQKKEEKKSSHLHNQFIIIIQHNIVVIFDSESQLLCNEKCTARVHVFFCKKICSALHLQSVVYHITRVQYMRTEVHKCNKDHVKFAYFALVFLLLSKVIN